MAYINGKKVLFSSEVNIVGGGGGGITPSGTINIRENGTHNVTNYVSAKVDVPSEKGNLIEVSTDTDMTNALVEDNLGKVYKFTGTSDTYETDAIYIVSEVE